jgi:hypothetical protein
METVTTERPFFSGQTHLQCETCEGRGSVGVESADEGGYAILPCKAGCAGGFIDCGECQDGTPADVILVCGDALCVGCLIRDGLPRGVSVARSTAAGAEWLKGWNAADGSVTQELVAVAWEGDTEPNPVAYYTPPKCPANDERLTLVDMPAIGGGL